MAKKFVTLFHRAIQLSLSKSVVLIAETMQKEYGYQSKYVCLRYDEDELVKEKMKINIEFLQGYYKEKSLKSNFPRIEFVKYLIKESKDIDVLHLFHLGPKTLLLGLIYKALKPKGYLYIKSDCDIEGKIPFRRWLVIRAIHRISNFVSAETKRSSNFLREKLKSNKVYYIPNGNALVDNTDESKKNIILTVGRIGTEQKNSEILLESLDGLELYDWSVIFVGPIEESFKEKINDFYTKNPSLKEKVLFKGPVYDRDVLNKYFKQSKVFCLTSRWESFAIVLVEAMYFDNYVISTRVGAANDLLEDEKLGSLIESKDQLRKKLSDITSGEIDLTNHGVPDEIKKNFEWKNILKPLVNSIENLDSKPAEKI